MEKINVQITGMSCEHCVKRVEESVSAVNGVEKIKVHLKKGTAKIKYDQQLTTSDEIVEAVVASGYQATIAE